MGLWSTVFNTSIRILPVYSILYLYRDKKYDTCNVVLYFGGDDYEDINVTGKDVGVGSGYRMKDGIIYDDEGDKINSRVIRIRVTDTNTTLLNQLH